MRHIPLRALALASAAALAVPLLGAQASHADSLQVDPDVATSGDSPAVISSIRGNCDSGETVGSIALKYTGNTHFTPGGGVIATFKPINGSTYLTGTGITGGLTGSPTVPAGWGDTVKDATFGFALHVASDTPLASYQVELQLVDVASGTTAGDGGGGRPQVKLDVQCRPAVSTTPQNQPPTVATHAQDQTGDEGDALAASGAFTDDGGANLLTITKLSGAGVVTQGADGTWTWSHTPDDNYSDQAVVIQAEDADGATATDSFNWSSTNVAPAVGAVTFSGSTDCKTSVSASFIDPGSGDTWTGGILWGDEPPGTAAAMQAVAYGGPVTGTHTYTTDGLKTVSVVVSDDDGGLGSSSAQFTSDTRNTAGQIMAPLVVNKGRAGFKIGSVIPIKVMVTGCDGTLPQNLDVHAEVTPVAASSGTVTLQSPSGASATVGTNMRPATDKYMYNFSTKNSQFTNLPLAAGAYTVAIVGGNFKVAPTPVGIQLVK